jgi:hypothetical protein
VEGPPPAALDLDAVRRVLRRAAELEATDPGRDERLDVDAVVAAATEAGLDEDVVRRAIAFERLGPPPGRRGRLLGDPVVVVDEELHGSAEDVLRQLDAWLVAGHHLRRDRLHAGGGTWTRRRGVVGSVCRTMRQVTGEGLLGDLARIDATAVDSGTGSCVVRVTADRRRERRLRGAAGAAVAGATTAGAVVGAVLLGPLALLAAPVSLLAGTGIALGGRRRARQVADEIDRLLHHVEHGARPTRLTTDLARRVIRGPAVP